MLIPSNPADATLAAIGTSTGAVLGYFYGANMEAVLWLFGVMVVDFFLGTIHAFRVGGWMSSVAKRGLISKCLVLFICAFGAGLDIACHVDFIQSAFIGAFLFAELGSIIETLDKEGFGSVIPHPVRQFLSKMKEKEIIKP